MRLNLIVCNTVCLYFRTARNKTGVHSDDNEAGAIGNKTPRMGGKVKWNQIIINFNSFQIATEKSPQRLDTHPQTLTGSFSRQLKYGCGS